MHPENVKKGGDKLKYSFLAYYNNTFYNRAIVCQYLQSYINMYNFVLSKVYSKQLLVHAKQSFH